MIALAQALLVVTVSLIRFRTAITLFFVFSAFAPRSLGLLLGGGDFSLTFPRIAIPLVFVIYLASYISRKGYNIMKMSDAMMNGSFILIVVIGIYKIVATAVNDVNLLYAIESLIFTSVPFILLYLSSTRQLFNGVVSAFVLSCVIISVIVIVENIAKYPLHFYVANPVIFNTEIQSLVQTNRGYRVQAIFDNPLSLSEYLLYALPILFYAAITRHRNAKLFAFLSLAGLCVTGLMTGSRGFLIFGIGTSVAYLVFYNWRLFSKSSKIILLVSSAPIFLFSTVGAAMALMQKIEQSIGVVFYLISDATERSTASRALQYYEVFIMVKERPIFGYGVLQNFSNQLDQIHRIDSFYLRSALESGVPGFLLFLLFLLITWMAILSGNKMDNSKENRAFFAMSLSLLVAFMGAKFYLSMPTNNYIFYALLGLVLGRKRRMDLLKINAHPPHP
ncbi:MAG: hypothetical protein CVU16_15335 [Betaproteobacteria bacterium HGW-Betaproteobacteria-10]|nr:MAG: hypothetical protein CVU16_15335 [Betaproteobacteria bacterium HGW-Betaproteobacteria-10]